MAAVQYHYGAFPPAELEWKKLIPLVGPASAALARYDGALSAIPNAGVMLTPLTTQEAVLSSRIEGTQATMGEVLEYEADAREEFTEERVADIQEVINYRVAMFSAVEMLKELPLCGRVIRDTHRLLLDGVRGQDKAPGEYRRTQNCIGPFGCTLETARFVPVAPEQLEDAMAKWERFMNGPYDDRLVQLAIIHAEFEALHPFHDGNGRIGRMLVPLFLHKLGILGSPTFYISSFFERNRDAYYDKLRAVSSDGDWTDWVAFFLQAITDQGNENRSKAMAILALHEEKLKQVAEMTHSQYATHAVDFLFRVPIFKASDFTKHPGIPIPTARRILGVLRDNGLLREVRPASGRRSAVYAFRELLNAAEGDEVF